MTKRNDEYTFAKLALILSLAMCIAAGRWALLKSCGPIS